MGLLTNSLNAGTYDLTRHPPSELDARAIPKTISRNNIISPPNKLKRERESERAIYAPLVER